MGKNFFYKCGSSRYFYRFFSSFSKERGEPACGRAVPVVETSFHYGAGKLRGLSFAVCGGEKCSNYFKYTEPVRKSQRFLGRLAEFTPFFSGLGDQIERKIERKNQFLVV